MKYDKTKSKIRKEWTKVSKQSNRLEKLKTYKNSVKSTNYFKNYYKWQTDWRLAGSINYELELKNFPEDLLPYIKVIPMIKTEDVYETSEYVDEFEFSYTIQRINAEEKDFNDYKVVASLSCVSEKVSEDPSSGYTPAYLKLIVILNNKHYFRELKQYAWVRG